MHDSIYSTYYLNKERMSIEDDLYTLRASQLFHIGYMDVESWQRTEAKRVIFQAAYGHPISDVWKMETDSLRRWSEVVNLCPYIQSDVDFTLSWYGTTTGRFNVTLPPYTQEPR